MIYSPEACSCPEPSCFALEHIPFALIGQHGELGGRAFHAGRRATIATPTLLHASRAVRIRSRVDSSFLKVSAWADPCRGRALGVGTGLVFGRLVGVLTLCKLVIG